jgi:hypothetical protein
MDINDLIQIIINFSQALGPIQRLITGVSYLLGTIFVIKSLTTFYKIGESGHQSGSSEPMTVPFFYLVGGAVLLFLPSVFIVVSNTVFGTGNVLQYAPLNPVNIVSAMLLLIQTTGLVWFLRGCVLLVHSGQPGVKEGRKGMVFLLAGIVAMNIETTAASLSTLLGYVATVTLSFKNHLGY